MDTVSTQQRILLEALKLFAKKGYEAVTVEEIATAVGIKAPSLYKHYKSKGALFDAILHAMETRDQENACACSVPEGTIEAMPDAYEQCSIKELIAFSKMQFRYWTEDEFAASFRKMLTVEQYKSNEMNRLYHQYLGAGPLHDLLGSEEEALLFYSPMHMLSSLYDESEEKSHLTAMLNKHFERWQK